MKEARSPAMTGMLSNLRSILRSSSIRAGDLSRALGVSEPTVWRWLRGEGLTLDRLDQICGFLGVDLRDIVPSENREAQEIFTLAQERVLAADRSLSLVFFAILHGSQITEILETFKIPSDRLEQHLQRLERLGLIERTRQGRLKPSVKKSVRWHRGGPLSMAFNRTVKHLFLSMNFGDPSSDYVSDMVAMNAVGRARVLALFEKLREDVHLIGEQERDANITNRDWTGVLMMIRPLDIGELTHEWSSE